MITNTFTNPKSRSGDWRVGGGHGVLDGAGSDHRWSVASSGWRAEFFWINIPSRPLLSFSRPSFCVDNRGPLLLEK